MNKKEDTLVFSPKNKKPSPLEGEGGVRGNLPFFLVLSIRATSLLSTAVEAPSIWTCPGCPQPRNNKARSPRGAPICRPMPRWPSLLEAHPQNFDPLLFGRTPCRSGPLHRKPAEGI